MEILFIIIMFALWLIPSAIYGQWWLFGSFLLFGICFGLLEYISYEVTGDTVSQHFWKWSVNNKREAWITLGCMLAGWLMLLLHLSWEMITVGRYS